MAFREYAENFGLDMEAYDEAVADPATEARVMLDKHDGEGLGVQGTPTFFLDGELNQPATEAHGTIPAPAALSRFLADWAWVIVVLLWVATAASVLFRFLPVFLG